MNVAALLAKVNSGAFAGDAVVKELKLGFVEDETQVAVWHSHEPAPVRTTGAGPSVGAARRARGYRARSGN